MSEKILVLRLSAMGDVVLTTIFLRALRRRFPDASVHYLTKRLYAPLVEHHPAVERVIPFDPKSGFEGFRSMARLLRGERYDYFFDLQKNLRSWPWSFYARPGHIGRTKKYSFRRRLLTRLGIDLLSGKPDIPAHYVLAGKRFGLRDDGKPPELFLSAESKSKADELLAGLEEPFWGLIPMASSFNKRWPHYAALGRLLTERHGGTCVVIGGPGEEEECGGIAREIGSAISLAGQLLPLEIGAVMARCRCAFGNDTGPMFIATAVDTPTVAFFGPTDQQIGCYPRGSNVRSLDRDLPCRPCTRNGLEFCPKGNDIACLRDIPPEEALAAAESLTGGLQNR